MGLEIVKWRLSSYVEKVRRRLSARQIRHEHYTEQLAAATATHDQPLSGHFMGNAHDFVMHSPIIAQTQHIHLNTNTWVLKELEKCTIPGAEFDSSARDPPPRCHPGTRVDMMDAVQNWLHQPEPSKKLLWVYGPVGVGKSAVLQSIAEVDAKLQYLGATIFFSRPFGRDDPACVWPTIAFQLAVKDTSYRAYVQGEIQNNPKLLKKGMREQFRKLIALPFGQGQVIQSSRPLSIFLDGLDECQGDHAQSEIIGLISEFAQEYPLAPLVWIIASRTEQHLKVTFGNDDVQKRAWRIYIPVDSDDGCRDVERYLRSEFERIRGKYPLAVPGTSHWPKESDIAILMRASSGLFLYASAILRFIDDPLAGDPISQLELIISIIGKAESPNSGPWNPLTTIHTLYTRILELIPPASYAVTKRILGFLLLEHGYGHWQPKTTSFWALCNLLGIKQNVAYGALHRLHSLLFIPDHREASSSSMMIFHASFSDYLTNPQASGKFCVYEEETLLDLWQCQFRLLQQTNISDYPFPQPGNIVLAWPSDPLSNKTLRNQLWMRTRLSFWATSEQSFGWPGLQLATPILDAFGEIDFSKLVDGYELPEARRLPELLQWLTHHLRPELSEAGLLFTIDIQNTSFEWIQRQLVSFRIEYRGREVVREAYTDSVFGSDNEPTPSLRLMNRSPVGQLLIDLMAARHRITSTVVIGSESAGRCAILTEEPRDDSQIFYFIPFTSNTQSVREGWT